MLGLHAFGDFGDQGLVDSGQFLSPRADLGLQPVVGFLQGGFCLSPFQGKPP